MRNLSVRIVVWLMLTAAAAIFFTLHFRLYKFCQFNLSTGIANYMAAAGFVFYVVLSAVKGFRNIHHKTIAK